MDIFKSVIQIDDDFSLEKIISCGQFFRPKIFDDNIYRFVYGTHILYIRQNDDKSYSISVDKDEWNRIWYNYFSLNTKYSCIRKTLQGINNTVDIAMQSGKGIRILKQDTWEMLITFIISQRRSIPSITTCVDNLCCNFGTKISTLLEGEVFLFPTPQQLLKNSVDIRTCGVGYRDRYIRDATEKVLSHQIDLNKIGRENDEHLIKTLKTIIGVGDKVANCIALFGYNRLNCIPIDVWILRSLNNHFDGNKQALENFAPYAGIVQQYLFYYEKYVLSQ